VAEESSAKKSLQNFFEALGTGTPNFLLYTLTNIHDSANSVNRSLLRSPVSSFSILQNGLSPLFPIAANQAPSISSSTCVAQHLPISLSFQFSHANITAPLDDSTQIHQVPRAPPRPCLGPAHQSRGADCWWYLLTREQCEGVE
jgi:hypothetical protein